jgi:uncharacterized glyoxalase superfamily metalloenzyme YdcJ
LIRRARFGFVERHGIAITSTGRLQERLRDIRRDRANAVEKHGDFWHARSLPAVVEELFIREGSSVKSLPRLAELLAARA